MVVNENLPHTIDHQHPKRASELDGLRGIAILQVVLWHYLVCSVNFPLASRIVHNFLGLTWSGVDLFFVLSGFLLGGILIDNKGSSNLFNVFYLRRCCRILPLYYLWILILAFIIFFIKSNAYFFPNIILFDLNIYHSVKLNYYICFIQNFQMALHQDWGNQWLGVTWSLAIEEQFYLLIPLVIYFTSARILPYVLLFFIALAPVLRTILFFHIPFPNGLYWSFLMMPCRCDALLLGVLCAFVLRQNWFKKFIHSRIWALYLIAVIISVVLMIINFKGQEVGTEYMSCYGYTLMGLFYACLLIIAVMEKKGAVSFVVRDRGLGKLGIISYGVYIFHQAVLALVYSFFFHDQPEILNSNHALATILALFLTVLLAWVSWTFLEKPIVDFGHQWVYKR